MYITIVGVASQQLLRGFGRFTRTQCLHYTRSRFVLSPPYGYTPETHVFCQGNPKSYKGAPLSRLTGALAKASPFGWGGAIKSRERDSLGCLLGLLPVPQVLYMRL